MTFIVCVICLAAGWSLSASYHERLWSKQIGKRVESQLAGVYRIPPAGQELHLDQDAVELPPEPVRDIRGECLAAHYKERKFGCSR